jgi:type I restriction enzyme S subunit
MSQLPESWAAVPIRELMQPLSDGKLVHQGWSPQCEPGPARSDSDWGALKTTAIQDGAYLPQHNKRLPDSLDPKERLEVQPGDLLMTCAGPRVRCGVACLVRETPAKRFISGKMYRFRANDHLIDPRLLEAFLRTPETKNQIDAMKTGISESGMNITHERFSQLVVPLAPRSEQKRIANKLDSVLTRVDAVNTRLARVAPILKRFRQSVLAAATSGRLTDDWRGNSQTGWSKLRAEEACAKVQSGGTPKDGFLEKGIPFLKVYNIVDQKVAFAYKPQYVSAEVHSTALRKSQVQPGDVLMNIVGPPLGKVAIVPFEHSAWNINQALTVFRPSEHVSSHWIYFVLCEGAPIREVLNRTKGSVGQINISLSQCRAFELPVPSMEEQAEIVRRVETLFAFADRLQARLQAAQAATERLTPALLAKAFRGELMPQDPNDEPATELLKRLASTSPALAPRRGRKMLANSST